MTNLLTMFGSSLPPVVCRKAHVIFTLFVFVCVKWYPSRFVFLFCLSSFCNPILPVSLDCSFWLPLRYSLMFIYTHLLKPDRLEWVTRTLIKLYLYSMFLYNLDYSLYRMFYPMKYLNLFTSSLPEPIAKTCKIYHTFRTLPNSKRKSSKGKIYSISTQIHGRSLSMLSTGTSRTSV